MFTNRQIRLFVMAVLVAAAVFITISAVSAPAPALIPVTGSNAEGLAIYQGSERSARAANQKGTAIYLQSERVLANPAEIKARGLAIYQLGERSVPLVATDGLAMYHQSERMQPVNWTKSSDPLYKYHQSEWFGR